MTEFCSQAPRWGALRLSIALAVVSVAGVMAALVSTAGAVVPAPSAFFPANVHYTNETQAAFEEQLARHAIKAAQFNRKAHHLHLALRDGRHLLVSYPGPEAAALEARLSARGVPVEIEHPVKTPVHHKLRYIVGGILLAIIAVLVFLLVNRRRRLALAGALDAPPAGGSPAPPTPPADPGSE